MFAIPQDPFYEIMAFLLKLLVICLIPAGWIYIIFAIWWNNYRHQADAVADMKRDKSSWRIIECNHSKLYTL